MAEVDVFGIFTGSLLLIALVVILFVVVSAIRKWMKDETTDGVGTGAGFTLSQLRQLHKTGQMNDEEFEKAKQILLGAAYKSSGPTGGVPVVTPQKPREPGDSTDRPQA